MDKKNNKDCLLLYATCPDMKTAKAIARALVDARLVACVNLLPGIISLFRWDGDVQEEGEVAFIAKTTKTELEAAKALFAKQHPYDQPAFVALSIADGLPGFLSWIESETADAVRD